MSTGYSQISLSCRGLRLDPWIHPLSSLENFSTWITGLRTISFPLVSTLSFWFGLRARASRISRGINTLPRSSRVVSPIFIPIQLIFPQREDEGLRSTL